MAKGDVVLDLEQALFVLQKKEANTGEWETQGVHTYRGRSDALTVLQRLRDKHPSEEWRAMLKQEAERYREGWKDCVEFVRRKYGVEAVMAEPGPTSAVPGSGRTPNAPPGRE